MTRPVFHASLLAFVQFLAFGILGYATEGRASERPAFAERPDDVFVARLRSAGITPTATGLRNFLSNVTATPEQRRVAKNWIRQLGSPFYNVRMLAMQELKQRRIALAPELMAGQTDPNSEIALRCSRLLHDHNPDLQDTLFIAALETIVRRRYNGFLEPIERVLDHSQSTDLFRAAIDAAVATTTASDIDTLRDWLKSPEPTKQILAIHALGRHSPNANHDVSRFLNHDDPAIQLSAAIAIARQTPQDSLATGLRLLSADDAWIRSDAARLLRDLTGQKFGYWAYATPDRRAEGVRKWSDWLANSTSEQPLKPLPVSWRSRNWLGQRLVCRWRADTLEEFDRHQRSDFSIPGFKYVWGCWGTPQGHRLVCDYDSKFDTTWKAVLEYDSAGNMIWKRDNLPGDPTCVQRLPNGNTLVAMTDPHLVAEYDPHGRLVWEFPINGRPTTAQRLPDGNTLVNLQKAQQVVMIDPAGAVHVLLKDLHGPYTAEMLDNGNILVTETARNRISEFDASGKRVWLLENLQSPAQSQRLPDGNTLVSDNRGLLEFSPGGDLVRHWALPVSGYASDRVRFHFY